MTDKPENPPAFPVAWPEWACRTPEPGMTLRDYFAVVALQGVLSNLECAKNDAGDPIKTVGDVAALAYKQADAMLKARQS